MSEEAVKELETEINEEDVIEAEIVSDGSEEAGESREVDEAGESAPPTLEEQLLATEKQAAEYLEGWQRERAEFANARKRMDRQRTEAYRNAKVDVIARLLPVIDDFQRALQSVPEDIADHSWFEGMQLVYRKLDGLLEKENIEIIPAVGQEFDPNFHDAVMQESSDEFNSGVVMRELQTGYRLGDRVIRPAMVIVAA